MSIKVNRKNIEFYPDSKRVIARFYFPGSDERAKNIIKKALFLPEEETRLTLNQVLINFSQRHRNISKILEKHFDNVKYLVEQLEINPEKISREKTLLIGAYFTMEYSIEAAAFFNPSIVEDPDQTALSEGEKKVIVSFRATGEGHVSSIVFRSGIINSNNDLSFRPIGTLVDIPEAVKKHIYNKHEFFNKLSEMDVQKELITMVIERLDDHFTYEELQSSIEESMKNDDLSPLQKKVVKDCDWLANSHYEITFSLDTAISERVIFPISDTERNGIEDARFVKFIDDDGSYIYYATYTAYNGYTILPKLLETRDFYHFKIMPLNGEYAQNKGMALFPRKINNKYAMVSRIDGENNYIMFSDNIHYWYEALKIQEPQFPWQFIQIGNCGSPLETDKGWLLLTHGVGPMRSYAIGVTLLDLENPTKVLGQTSEPLMSPDEKEREGYVPNVIYSCGSLINNNELIIPYAMADYATSFATVSLDELFSKLVYY
ncbi:MAG: glycoside hydrolase family 130 protein [Bacillota bacterium]|nr:glycoside hydrolase family 130 protein [Bacillota bacterium]